MRRTILAALFVAAPLVQVGCNRGSGGADERAAAQAEPATPVPNPADPASDPAEPNVAQGAGGSGADAVAAPKPGPKGTGGATGGTSGIPEGAPGTSGAAPAASTGAANAPPDPKALLTKVRSKRTQDDEARALLAQAEAAGASPRDLARAANRRGKALFATPDRAQAFYEWAADKDPTYAEPVFNLAKLSVMQGDVPTTIERLQQVAKRKGGRKLLDQIGFDPTWEIVKDDPEVRKLLR